MRPEKTTIVEDLSARLNASPFLIVTEYAGMNVSEFAELRHRLARAGAECKVVKNTFLRKAAAEIGFPDLGESLAGQTAIVTGETDVCAAAKVLKTFSTEFQRPSVKVGVLDHAVISKEQIQALADLPTKPVLQAQLLGVLKSPLQKLVTVLNEPGASLARLLKAKVDKEGGAEGWTPSGSRRTIIAENAENWAQLTALLAMTAMTAIKFARRELKPHATMKTQTGSSSGQAAAGS